MYLLCALLVAAACCSGSLAQTSTGQSYSIKTTWNGVAVSHSAYNFTLLHEKNGFFRVNITAPFFDDPQAPDERPGESSSFHLWEYEVFELYFLGANDHYLQIDVGPHGHYAVYFFDGSRNLIKTGLSMNYSAKISGDQWGGKMYIPLTYMPVNTNRMNAYAMYGSGRERQFEALYPSTAINADTSPDFHRLKYFGPVDLSELVPSLEHSTLSSVWQTALENEPKHEEPVRPSGEQTSTSQSSPTGGGSGAGGSKTTANGATFPAASEKAVVLVQSAIFLATTFVLIRP